MSPPAVLAALGAAREAAQAAAPWSAPADGVARTRRVAVGDPQAPLGTFFAILHEHGLLGAHGRLRPEVALVSMGDHFDWGRAGERDAVAAQGLELLAWLAAHPADQVTLLAGNHDLARVGELWAFDDATFAAAQAEADAGYGRGQLVAPEAEFCARYALPSWEVAARDLSTFRAVQRAWVAGLLRARRLRAACAPAGDLLLCHAGVTRDDLALLGLRGEGAQRDARAVAAALNAALDAAVDAWRAGALTVPGLYQPGDARAEGRGVFYHRPTCRDEPALLAGPPRRRFDPRTLPTGLTQAIGHIRDRKCRELLGATEQPALDGPLRSMRVSPAGVAYQRGVPSDVAPDVATMLFLDGGMLHAQPGAYELLDLELRRPAARVPT